MNALDYFLKANLYGLLFAGCYVLLLRRHTFFGLNRVYLLASVVLSLVLPLATLPSETPETLPIPTGVIMLPATIAPAETGPDWEVWGAWGYGVVALVLLAALLTRMFGLLRIIQQSGKVDHGDHIQVLPTNAAIPTFSFFRYVVLSPADRNNSLILQHELVHVRQWHSVDVLAMQVLRTIFWGCPALLLLERALRQVHEFLADQQVSAHERNYARLLVDYSFGIQPVSLANGFFNPSLLKQRIQMLQQGTTSRWALGKYILIAPLILGLLAMTTAREEIAEVVISQAAGKPTIVSGKVVSAADGKGLPGATIIVKDQTRGTTTDANGQYKIYASPSESLVFSFVGFKSQVINIAKAIDINGKRVIETGNNVYINALMTPDHMGKVRTDNKRATAKPSKANLSESASTRKTSELAISGSTNSKQLQLHSFAVDNHKNARYGLYNDVNPRSFPLPDSLRKTKVSVKTPTGAKPLYIIDGVEQPNQEIEALDPNTIESINVLKGDLTATYGVKGKNGVILITTKKK